MSANVWIVDDDDAVRGVLEAMVKELGHEVRTFNSPESALSEFEKIQPDIVITDVRMPGMSGIELTRALLEIDPTVIVMVLTGFPSIPDAVEAIRAGAKDFLSKPCRIEEIRIRIDRALETQTIQAKLKSTKIVAWALIASLPVWFILGMLLAAYLQ